MHAKPTAVTLKKLDDPNLVEVAFFGPTLAAAGETATYPRAEVLDWIRGWLAPSLVYKSVASSTLVAVAYDAAARELRVVFQKDAEYLYRGVAPATHRALLDESDRVERGVFGASVGSLFAREVRGKYPYERVAGARRSPPAAPPPAAATTPAPASGAAWDEFYGVAEDMMTGGKS